MADRVAHNTIKEILGPTRVPVLSEEGREMLYGERRNWEFFFLVDPLDGTVEFINGTNEFTVNIALLADNECVASVLYVPYYHKMYLALKDIESRVERLPLADNGHTGFKVAISRSHQTPDTHERINQIKALHPDLEIIEQSSSYKFCMLAEGKIDYYIRTTNTYEWDTAAGELILAEAGGHTCSYPEGEQLKYNKEDLKNPWFEAHSHNYKG